MRAGGHALSPLRAVTNGLAAGVAGTASMDAVRYLRYRREGGQQGPLAWEFAPIESWAKAPDPGQVAKRLIEGFTQRDIPDRWAWLVSTAAHWGYGSGWAGLYGVVAGSLRRPIPPYGAAFGAAVWVSGYVALPVAGLYQPIWDYDTTTLARDLSAHLAYGSATGTAFWLMARAAGALSPRR